MSEGYWAIVELMGHRVRPGFVCEVNEFGIKLCRIEVPTPDGGSIASVEKYGGAAIYCITETTKEKVLARLQPYEPPAMQLASGRIGDEDPDFVSCAECEVALFEEETRTHEDGRTFCKPCFEAERMSEQEQRGEIEDDALHASGDES
jgi:hypothetical protein